jgi:poly(3-hydroxybutyrate) depolymerase
VIRRIAPAVVTLLLAACGGVEVPAPQGPHYLIDPDRITVSGISSGAYMAGQLHVAHSALFHGAGLIAGGPFYCARGSVMNGVGVCVKGGDIPVGELLADTRAMAAAGKLDALANLRDDDVWLFHGKRDALVSAEVTAAARTFYEALIDVGRITYVDGIETAHGMPTLDTGKPCAEFGAPFIQACDYDAAGALLTALYGPLAARTAASEELRPVAQPGGEAAGMLDRGFVYVPASCAGGARCGIHVALHGCMQSAEFVGDAFARGAGYNEWAESNQLIVLYPQVASSKIAPMNPYGCWDWWGYTGDDYATREGPQIEVIMAMLDALGGTAH